MTKRKRFTSITKYGFERIKVIKMQIRKVLLFAMILLVSLTVVTATDITDDDSAAAVETPQVEQQSNDIEEYVQNDVQEDNLEEEIEYSGDNPQALTSLTDGGIYENAIITLGADATYTDASVLFLNNVTLTSDNVKRALTNMKIEIFGDNVTINKVTFNHNTETTGDVIVDWQQDPTTGEYVPVYEEQPILGTNTDTKVIDIISGSNVNINNVDINLAKNQSWITMGISATSVSHNIIINNSNIDVQAAAQGLVWKNDTGYWYSTLAVAGVVFDNSNYLQLENSTVTISSTTNNPYGTTMPAISVRKNANQVTIKNNTISSTGAQYVYGVMMSDLVNNVEIINNTVSVSGLYYVAGIDASTASNSKVSKNKVNAISENATAFPDGYESLAYGIISDTYSSGNTGNHICQNNITISAIVCYGVEMYRGMNNFICSNIIDAEGIRVMGVALAHSTNNKIINNNMTLTGYPGSYHPFYEEITPVNAGIIFTNQSNGNWIQGNDIQIDGNGDLNTAAINLQNSTTATINGNYLKAVIGTDPDYGNEAIKVDSLCSNMNIGTNTGVVLYNCDCGCMSNNNNNGGVETESTNQLNTFYKTNTQNIKKESDNIPTVVINDENYLEYGKYQAKFNACDFTLTKQFESETNIIYNFTSLAIKIIHQQNCHNYHVLAINCLNPGKIPITVWTSEGNINGLYAPLCHIVPVYNDSYDINITNSTLYTFNYGGSSQQVSLLVENNTFYSNEIPSSNDRQLLLLKNNRFYTINSDTQTVTCGLNANDNENWTLENNGPNYENAKLLDNTNYNNYFNEDNTLKSEYADSVLFAAENITNPVIINAPVTLTALRGVGGYSTVNFIEGSDNSVIEDSFINKVTLNGVSNIKVNNNKLLSDDSVIEVVGTLNSIIENNTINTKNTYTVTFDEDSLENIVRNNELFAGELTGDDSVQTTDDNTVESNMPIPVPELKIDTTEFTAGQTATIQASIYLGKKVASDITGGKVVFKVNGKTLKNSEGKVIYAKVVNGVAKIDDYTVPASWTNDTIITAVYTGSSKCEALNTTSSMTITKNEPTITTEDITAAKASTITLTATVKDGDKAITTGKVVFKINGKTVKDTNGKVIYANVDANGVATIPDYTIPESMKTGTYTITALFTAPNYEKLQSNTTLTITA